MAITIRRVLLRVERQKLTVSEAAAGDDDGHISRVVVFRVAQIAAQQNPASLPCGRKPSTFGREASDEEQMPLLKNIGERLPDARKR